MNPWWSYFWPIIAIGLACGIVAGAIGFRRRPARNVAVVAGALAALAGAVLWHGPLEGANRFTKQVEHIARLTLDNYEMTQVTARLHRAPLSRRLILAGPADDFQRSELVRIMGGLPGAESASWSNQQLGLPLIAEGAIAALGGFLIGLLLAYLVELRRRYNADWKW